MLVMLRIHAPLIVNAAALPSKFSRAYLHHLFKADEIQGLMLLTWHNLRYYQDLMAGLRYAIEQGQLADFAADFDAQQARGDIDPL